MRRKISNFINRIWKAMMKFNVNKGIAILLILSALDSLTAFFAFKLAPETFALYETNQLARYSFITGHVEGWLLNTAMSVLAIVGLFAITVIWKRLWLPRFCIFVLPIFFVLAISGNLVSILILPETWTFTILTVIPTIIFTTFLWRSTWAIKRRRKR